MVLDFSINLKKKKKKLNCSLYTKKTNNTTILFLQKFKNYKTKKKKGFFFRTGWYAWYRPKHPK